MNAKTVKSIIGVLCAAAVMSSVFVPVSVIADIAVQFPDVDISLVQMLVALPSLAAIASNFLIAKLSTRFYKRSMILVCTAAILVAGVIPLFFHQNFFVLLAVALVIGIGMGGIQNAVIALIANAFEGAVMATVMGMLSLAIGLGALLFRSVSAVLASNGWTDAYLAYLILVPLLLIQLVCLPKGTLEQKAPKGERAKVPGMVITIAAFGFCVYLCYQMFDANVSLIIAERGIGATGDTGIASSVNAVATMLPGLFIVPFVKLFKNQSMTVAFLILGAGLACLLFGQSLLPICIAAACMAIANALFTVNMNNTVSSISAVGMGFNIALASGVSNLGQALSPLIMGVAAAPFGDAIDAKLAIGLVIMGICTVVGFLVLRKVGKTSQVSGEGSSAPTAMDEATQAA